MLISYLEFRDAKRMLGHDDLSRMQLTKLFNGIDDDGDGSLSLHEFMHWVPRSESISLASIAIAGLRYQFFAALNEPASNLLPSLVLPSGGQLLTVIGAGFDASKSHKCSFSDRFSSTHEEQSVASVINTTHLVCESVSWRWPRVVDGNIEIKKEDNVIPFQNGSMGLMPLSIPHVVRRVVPSLGAARGGDTVEVHGYGFDSRNSYRCHFGGVTSPLAVVKNPLLLLCSIPPWSYASSRVSFELHDSSLQQIARIGVRGSLEFVLMQEPQLPFVLFEQVVSISPAFIDREGGTNSGLSPSITLTGAGFDTLKQYRCELSDGERIVQSFVTIPRSATLMECLPPEWDRSTMSRHYVKTDLSLTLISSHDQGWTYEAVNSYIPLQLHAVSINKVPWYTIVPRSESGLWVSATTINITEPMQDSNREFSFQWASMIFPGSRCVIKQGVKTTAARSKTRSCLMHSNSSSCVVEFTGLEPSTSWTVSVTIKSSNASSCEQCNVYGNHRKVPDINGSLPVQVNRAVFGSECSACHGEDLVAEVTITEDTAQSSATPGHPHFNILRTLPPSTMCGRGLTGNVGKERLMSVKEGTVR
jgi:hypothetical protein